jgi:hypothetical protein
MKKIIIFIIIFVAGYLLGSFFPLSLTPSSPQGDIQGDTELRVIVLRDDNQPVPNLEVDVAEKPGQPPLGGTAETDQQGVATFFVKPGTYYIYFNDSNFPSDLQTLEQGSKRIEVREGEINEEIINLKSQ